MKKFENFVIFFFYKTLPWKSAQCVPALGASGSSSAEKDNFDNFIMLCSKDADCR